MDTDYYALDDTWVGRLVQAGLLGAVIAVPDYIPAGNGARTGTRLALTGVGIGAAALANYYDEDPDHQAEDLVEQIPEGEKITAKTLVNGALIGAATVGVAAWGLGRAAQGLAKRGVRRPYALFGILAGGGVLVASEIAARDVSQKSEHV